MQRQANQGLKPVNLEMLTEAAAQDQSHRCIHRLLDAYVPSDGATLKLPRLRSGRRPDNNYIQCGATDPDARPDEVNGIDLIGARYLVHLEVRSITDFMI